MNEYTSLLKYAAREFPTHSEIILEITNPILPPKHLPNILDIWNATGVKPTSFDANNRAIYDVSNFEPRHYIGQCKFCDLAEFISNYEQGDSRARHEQGDQSK